MHFGLFVPLFGDYGDALVLAGLAQDAEKAWVTWWVDGISPWRFGWRGSGKWPLEAIHARILAGPPRE